jgi:hypothetical protein
MTLNALKLLQSGKRVAIKTCFKMLPNGHVGGTPAHLEIDARVLGTPSRRLGGKVHAERDVGSYVVADSS